MSPRTSSARIPGRDLRIDVDPDALHLRVLAHRVETHLATIAALPHAAERRARVHALVAVDPHHAGTQLAREAVRTRQVRRPESRAEAVVGAVGDPKRLVVVLEGQHGDERPEDLLLRDAVAPAL